MKERKKNNAKQNGYYIPAATPREAHALCLDQKTFESGLKDMIKPQGQMSNTPYKKFINFIKILKVFLIR